MTFVEIFLLAGGLGMFLFGMNIMGTGLRSLAGDKLQGILEKATRKPILGVALGVGATALVQSSGATTIMTIGFVSSGMMTLEQSRLETKIRELAQALALRESGIGEELPDAPASRKKAADGAEAPDHAADGSK